MTGRLERSTLNDRFLLGPRIGRGAMGEVYRATDATTGRDVAIKLMHVQFAEDPIYLERFAREVELARRVDSPNVVKVLGYGVANGVPYLVLEFIDGPSLRDVMEAHGAYSWPEGRPIIAQIARGLAAAHEARVLHRDVKPSNVLVGTDGVARLTDFGIAKASDLTQMTGTAAILGTPTYLAPEGSRDELSDIYSLGVLGYELLAGVPPFDGDTYQTVLLAHITEDPDLDRLPPEARAVIGPMLAKVPQKRPGSVAEVLRLLGEDPSKLPTPLAAPASGGEETVIATAGLPRPAPAEVPAAGRRSGKVLLALAGAGLALVAGVIAVSGAIGPAPDPTPPPIAMATPAPSADPTPTPTPTATPPGAGETGTATPEPTILDTPAPTTSSAPTPTPTSGSTPRPSASATAVGPRVIDLVTTGTSQSFRGTSGAVSLAQFWCTKNYRYVLRLADGSSVSATLRDPSRSRTIPMGTTDWVATATGMCEVELRASSGTGSWGVTVTAWEGAIKDGSPGTPEWVSPYQTWRYSFPCEKGLPHVVLLALSGTRTSTITYPNGSRETFAESTSEWTETAGGSCSVEVRLEGDANGQITLTTYTGRTYANSVSPTRSGATGAAVTLRPLDRASYTFSCTADRRYGWTRTFAGGGSRTTFYDGVGASRFAGGFSDDATGEVTAGAAGQCTIEIDPGGLAEGTASITVYAVPADVDGSASITTPTQFTLYSFQKATLTFTAGAGHRYEVTVSFDGSFSGTYQSNLGADAWSGRGSWTFALDYPPVAAAPPLLWLTDTCAYDACESVRISLDPAGADTGGMTVSIREYAL